MHIESFKMQYSSDNQSIFWFKSKTERKCYSIEWAGGGKKPTPSCRSSKSADDMSHICVSWLFFVLIDVHNQDKQIK